MLRPRFAVLTGLVLFAAFARLIPHPWNFTPLTAMALFSGAHFSKKSHAFIVPFAALLISDLIIGFYWRIPVVYLSWLLIIGIGFFIRHQRKPSVIAGGVITASTSFFLITNFGVWAFGTLYPKTIQGLLASYTAALPFFRNALIGDAFYALILFGGFMLAEKKFPVLQQSSVAAS